MGKIKRIEDEPWNPAHEYTEPAKEKEREIPAQKHATPVKPYTTEHQKVKSRLTGMDHEISFGPLGGGFVPKNPFASKAQQGYMFAHPEILGKSKLKEWSSKTDFSKLPKKVKRAK